MRFAVVAVALLSVVPARADQPEPIAVPFEMLQSGKLISGHLAVQVKINGKGPYRLVFDTGAPMILVSTRVGKEAGLMADKRPAKPGALAFPGQVRIRRLELGDVVAEDLTGVMLDHPTVKAIAEVFGPIDGIVGFPFFARYRTAIDYQAKTLTFVPNGYRPGDVVQMLMATLMQSGGRKAAGPQVLSPAAQWGMRVEKAEGDEDTGVTVAEVFTGGAAAKAGMKAGDRLLTLDGRWTDTVADCYLAAAEVKAGQPAELLLKRNGKEIKRTVRPAEGL
ncbi:MAG TPA: retropepsin-like aspartic protease [Gemmataceae bacterium]|nr:retropepsin-like aspartic protease [Gemmataceae bacterium]